MKYYTSTTEYNCGIDLHARQMYVCLTDRQGQKLVHTNIKHNDFNFFLKLVAPYRHDLTVCSECMFGWYWLADACQAASLTFVLAHALYVRAIHGGKTKNDRIDSENCPAPNRARHRGTSGPDPPLRDRRDWAVPHRERFPRGKSAHNWSRPLLDDERQGGSRLHFEWRASGCTAVSFWTVLRPWIVALEGRLRFRVTGRTLAGPIESE